MSAPAPEFEELERTLESRRLQVEAALRRLAVRGRAPAVEAAVEDSLFAPAKRLRPILSLLVAEVLRGNPDTVLPAGCAIEMVHTASLILDDLPSMDDAKTRRGRPTCHVAHGEATAILAAFALMNRAFEIVASGWDGGPDPTQRLSISRELARAIGQDGLIAGQSVDLQMTDRTIDFPTLEFIHSRKTGALFVASAAMGALAARAPAADTAAVKAYAKNLGLAFQIVDDILNVEATPEQLGKAVGSDAARGKATYPALFGLDQSKTMAAEAVAAAIAALERFGDSGEPLRALARYIIHRTH